MISTCSPHAASAASNRRLSAARSPAVLRLFPGSGQLVTRGHPIQIISGAGEGRAGVQPDSHADVAWAIMHALLNEPLTAASGGANPSILEFY